MNKEDKELLLKDLCARLPYGVYFHFTKMFGIFSLAGIKVNHMFPLNDVEVLLNGKFPIQWCKPYLRPMSSMTDEEKKEHEKTGLKIITDTDTRIWVPTSYLELDWLNAHHFDYRGLIPKGLAVEVTEENNPYKD